MKGISSRTRFEVLKRDHFRCQYCGAGPNEALLEVDHIHPRADAGRNKLTNLITACVACNNGKGKVHLDDHTAMGLTTLTLMLALEYPGKPIGPLAAAMRDAARYGATGKDLAVVIQAADSYEQCRRLLEVKADTMRMSEFYGPMTAEGDPVAPRPKGEGDDA